MFRWHPERPRLDSGASERERLTARAEPRGSGARILIARNNIVANEISTNDIRENKDCSDFVNLFGEVETDTMGAMKTTEEEFRKLLGVEQDPEEG